MAGSTTFLWAAAGLIGLISVAPEMDRAVSDDVPAHEAVDGYAIERAPDGQFYVDGQIGGTNVRFLVDPEADAVLIAGPDAARIGLPAGNANVTLDSLTVGPTRQRAVAAQVAPAMPVSLLGRAYLSRLAAADVRGDRLILR